jgi:hypothetical protein
MENYYLEFVCLQVKVGYYYNFRIYHFFPQKTNPKFLVSYLKTQKAKIMTNATKSVFKLYLNTKLIFKRVLLKTHSRWMVDLNEKGKTLQLLEENTGRYLNDLE